MGALIQKLHPALRLYRQRALASRRSHRSRLRLISGGVAVLARLVPVGASDTSSSGANSSDSVTLRQ